MLDMEEFSEAVVGTPGEGLNAEQRRRLSIAVELAAKPDMLLFLDEPTSGLDSQSSPAIIDILRKLAGMGQAVVATIHQPSSTLFQKFDRLLFLGKGGRTVYFGEIGDNAQTVINYFQSSGARPCGQTENPAEYLLEVVGSGRSPICGLDWADTWKSSAEIRAIMAQLDHIHERVSNPREGYRNEDVLRYFAVPWYTQLVYTIRRVFQYHWRSPSYVWAKLSLGILAAL
jgi:ATP-binding cassette, subfamily G (WHITE), member 2, PDR